MLHPLAEPRRAYVERVPRRAARAGGRLDRLHPRRSPTRSASGSRAATGCSAPTASAAATRGAALRASSRSTAITSRSPRCASSPPRARSSRRSSPRRSRSTASTPTRRCRRPYELRLRRRSRSPTSATSTTSRSSRSWSRSATRSRSRTRSSTLESDKATMDVPAPVAGVVKEILVSLGDQVSQGSALMTIEGPDAARRSTRSSRLRPAVEADASAAAEPPPASAEPAARPARPLGVRPARTRHPASPKRAGRVILLPHRAGPESSGIYASPSARRLARELGVELSRVSGSGRKGRITKDDVQQAGRRQARPRLHRPGAVRLVWTCCHGRPSTSRSSVRSSASRARGSSGSRRPTWRATG